MRPTEVQRVICAQDPGFHSQHGQHEHFSFGVKLWNDEDAREPAHYLVVDDFSEGVVLRARVVIVVAIIIPREESSEARNLVSDDKRHRCGLQRLQVLSGLHEGRQSAR